MRSRTAKLYGIPNCATVKKARAWLAGRGIDVAFHDFRKDGVTPDLLQAWLKRIEWQRLLNRSGTTWRKLPDPVRARVTGAAEATALMLDHPSVIRRPVLELGDQVHVGFDEPTYRGLFTEPKR